MTSFFQTAYGRLFSKLSCARHQMSKYSATSSADFLDRTDTFADAGKNVVIFSKFLQGFLAFVSDLGARDLFLWAWNEEQFREVE